MSGEAAFVAALRRLATHPAARGLMDDAAVLAVSGEIVVTHDMLVEGVHYLPGDPASDVAWKLVATNLSDLAAKGATPLGVLLGFPLGEAAWDAAFVAGLSEVLTRYDMALLGGDTVAGRGARTLGLTAIGQAPTGGAPDRRGARAGDRLWVTGTIGDAGLGLRIAKGEAGSAGLLERYRRPVPRLDEGRVLAAQVSAMCDVSDGLLIDAARIAAASGLAVTVDLAALPLSGEAAAYGGDDRAARLAAATAGDDYELLFAAAPDVVPQTGGVAATCIGRFTAGRGLVLVDGEVPLEVPETLGWQHG